MTIKIESQDWNGIGEADQDKIRAIIADHFDGQALQVESGGVTISSNPACDAACNVAEGAAVAACQALPFPANLVCAAAAREAGNFCRSRC